MICKECCEAADRDQPERHNRCESPDSCCCQHKTGEWIIREKKQVR